LRIHIQELDALSKIDIDVMSIMRSVIEPVISDFSIDVSASNYQFDESMDCIFNVFQATDELSDLIPFVARKLNFKFSRKKESTISKALDAATRYFCRPQNIDPALETNDGFKEWVIMEDVDRRSTIESVVTTKLKNAYKLTLQSEQQRFDKCLQKLNPSNTRSMYRRLRRKYPDQRFIMDMIPGIHTMHCARTYASDEMVQELISDDSLGFVDFMRNELKSMLSDTFEFAECRQSALDLIDRLELSLLTKHSDLKRYPVRKAMTVLVEIYCRNSGTIDVDDLTKADVIAQIQHDEL